MTTDLYINSKTIIKKLYHISDIHIRRYDRHDEYKVVFNNLYNYLKKDCKNDSLIIITGDLLHNKDNLTPDCIVMAYDFLSMLSKIRPVILIPGNHDFVETNTHIKDSIGAILSDHDIPNLYYIRDSGFYRFCNIIFGVVSIFDKIELDIINYKKKMGDIMVGLYHGPVGNTETAVGIILKGDKKPSYFTGFDYVLLGDIHKYQHIAANMAYASSLISQNFSETDEYHGVLEWDIINGTTNYVIIDNPYRYMVFDIYNGIVLYNKNNINIGIFNFPTHARIRLNIMGTSMNDINIIKKTIRKRYTNIIFYDNFITDEINNNIIIPKIDYLQMLDPYIEKLSLSEKKECIRLFQNELNNINMNVDKWCFQWELLDLHFSNMFAYGENNIIDFTKLPFNEIVGLFAPNSHGKSSLIDIILLSLYDNFSRNTDSRYRTIPSYIVNNNATTFEMIIRFKLGNDIYTIDKRGKVIGKNTSKTGKRIDFTNYTFIKNCNGVNVNLTRKDRFETQKEIDNIIGSYSDFCLTTLFLQNREKNFYDMSPMERKTFLYKLLCLDKFETIFDIFNTKEKESNIKMKSILEELKNIDIENINNNIYDYKKNIDKYNKSLIKMGKMKLAYNVKRKKYMTKLNCNKDDININYTVEHIPMLNKMIDLIDTIIDTNINIQSVNNNIYLQYNKPIINIPKEMIICDWKAHAIYSNDIDDMSDCANYIYPLYLKYKENTKLINDLDYKIKLLEEQIKSNSINMNCDVCMSRKSKYDKLVSDYDDYNKQKNNIIMPDTNIIYNMVMEYGYDGDNNMEDIYNYICKSCCSFMRMNDNNELFFNEFIKDIMNHYRNIKEYTNVDINKLNIAKNKLIKNIQYIENNKVLRLIDRIERKLDKIENKMIEYNRDLNKITYNLALEESKIKQFNEKNNDIINYTTNHNIYNALKKATHINGIPSMIISSRLNDINTKVNDMIAPFIAKKVNVVLDGNNILVHILDSAGHIINILGGMEMFMINIAFKIALAGISILPKTKMLIIDEGVSVLDKSHIDKFNNIAQFLNSNYNHIILISHIDGLKDHITHFININKINGKSYINYI